LADPKPNLTGQNVEPANFPPVSPVQMTGSVSELEFLADVPLKISAKLGETRMTVCEILNLKKGSIIKLDRLAGEMADLYVNDNYLGKAEVIVVGDSMALRVSDLIKASPEEQTSE